ncbi:unnamed protein product [Microthlaspi erraticum]|uniref:Integrase catalytic domain-containing protein n=1 Tax=Microthlaspi erraticum TaxID=1685480 RepID=A0A6D2HB66_9BRAS|nr:unnamed protein product [Microthlaspi erraticum]
MTWKINLLHNIVDIHPCSIGLPDGDKTWAIKQGDICLGGDLWLRGVLYCPELKCSLISVAKLLKVTKGSITFTEDLCVLQDRTMKTLIGAGEECNGVYVFRGVMGASAHSTTAASSGARDLWHRRLGHPSSRVLSLLSSYVDVGKPAEAEAVCDTCFRAKHTRDCFQESSNKAAGLFDLIHCDIWGPYRQVSSSGASYFLTIVDDFSRAVWIYHLREKGEVANTIEKFCAMVDRQFDKKIRIVRSDNGLEFMCLKHFFAKEGMLHQTSCVYTPQQNGRVERKHRHILNVSRSIMFQAHIPVKFWGECVLAAVHLINRTPSTLLNGKTPYEMLYGEAPQFTRLKVFGFLCYAHKISREKDKFGERSRRCIFMGYPNGQKVVVETTPIVSTQETWDDDFQNRDQHVTADSRIIEEVNSPIVSDTSLVLRGSSGDKEVRGSLGDDHDVRGSSGCEEPSTENIVETEPEMGKGKRQRSKPSKLSDYVLYAARCNIDPSPLTPSSASSSKGTVPYSISNYITCDRFSEKHKAFLAAIDSHYVPETYAEAVKYKEWRDAMGREIKSQEAAGTFYLTELPPGKQAIASRWIYTNKYYADGSLERHKARLVIRGDKQVEGRDYEETFAPVAKLTTIRMFLKVAAVKRWEVHQMDVHNAFLHGELEEEVYMKLPLGFHSQKKNVVCRLRKALYGLKQAPRCWFAKLTNALRGYGFSQEYADYSLFTLARGEVRLYVLIYVDDLLIGGNDTETIKRFKAGKPVATPMAENSHLQDEDDSPLFTERGRYQRLVGRLVYLTFTRPELSYVVHVLAQFLNKPQAKHWDAALRVVRYLKGSPGKGIVLSSSGDLRISAVIQTSLGVLFQEDLSAVSWFISATLLSLGKPRNKGRSCYLPQKLNIERWVSR